MLALEAKQVPGTLRYETRKLSLRWLAAPAANNAQRGIGAKRLAQLGWIRRERAVGRGTGYALPRHPEPEQTAASEPPAAVGVGASAIEMGIIYNDTRFGGYLNGEA